MIERLFTIGAYGFTGEAFADALRRAGVDGFIDVRARRGVRGSEYAFANAKRLQKSLADAGIAYAHAKELAPTDAIRQAQFKADAAAKIAKRDRTRLGDAFVSAYRQQFLASFDARAFIAAHAPGARRACLFCVEREPGACHRSLLADRLGADLGIPVEHLSP